MKANPITALVRFLTIHRRLVAAVAAMACVFALASIASGRDQTLVTVVVTADRVGAGHMLAEADLTTLGVPTQVVPDGALVWPADAIGRMLSGTLPRGAILTAEALVAESGRGTTPGHLILPVHLAQTDVLKLIHAGDRIALLITDMTTQETSIAEDVLVVAIPEVETSGFLGASTPDYLLVDVPNNVATLLAGASVTSTVTVALQ
jgi:hypothetical protein